MDEFEFDLNLDEFSLESILAEYRAETDNPVGFVSPAQKQSRTIVAEALGDVISASVTEPEDTISQTQENVQTMAEEFFGSETEYESFAPADFPEADDMPNTADDEPITKKTEAKIADKIKLPKLRKKTFAETIMAPIIGVLAAVMEREKRLNDMEPKISEIIDEPEMAHEKAYKLYKSQLHSLKLRSNVAIAMCVILCYISFGYTGFLPVFGMLGSNIAACSLVCLIILSTVMLAGLDVFTNGVLRLIAGRPSSESLVSVSCILSIIDAFTIVGGYSSFGLPMCAISAVSLCCALISNRATCEAMLASLSVITSAKEMPSAITTEAGIVNNFNCVVKTRLPLTNFMRRSEGADLCEISFTVAAPFILGASLILSIFASFKFGAGAFIHILSAMTAVSASFVGLIAFTVPYAMSARRLRKSGAAIAGYEGCADVGTAARFVVLDRDIFPTNTIKIKSLELMNKNNSNRVISYTASLIIASGSSLAPAFTELMEKSSCVVQKTEHFESHEGGGVLAMINNERVLVGSSSFMSLMGVRLPFGLTTKNGVFTVINGQLAGIFDVSYTPNKEVRRALNILLHDYSFPIFAVRDFNINPMMLRQKFKVVTDDFEFPTFKERYRISAIENAKSSPIAAITTTHGLGIMVAAADNARKLYKTTKAMVIFSFATIAISMAYVLLLCGGEVLSAELVAKLLSFMILTTVPTLVISHNFK